MITAVDTSILLDILIADVDYLDRSKRLLSQCIGEGKVIACPVVWGELRPLFDTREEMDVILGKMSLEFDPFDKDSSVLAGEIWQTYRKKGGTRNRVIPDFLIGAHATVRAERLATRDRGFYRPYFKKLPILEP